MGDSIKCQLCEKAATVYLTQVINSKIHKIDLCQECAQNQDINKPHAFSLIKFLVKTTLFPVGDSDKDLKCKHCGFTHINLKQQARLGCCFCYDTFKEIIMTMLQGTQKGTHHHGKIPKKSMKQIQEKMQLEELKNSLKVAIKQEHYEDAAHFRDRINEIITRTKEENLS
jgi:protein arginine kinase activator